MNQTKALLTGLLLALTLGPGILFAQEIKLVRFAHCVDDSLHAAGPGEVSLPCTTGLKNPELAGSLSLFVPGLGQIYNGEVVKGATFMGAFLGSIAMLVAVRIGGTHDSISTWGWIGVGMVGTSYLWGVIDAPISANRINREILSRTKGSLLQFQTGGRSVSLKAGLARDGFGACITFGL